MAPSAAAVRVLRGRRSEVDGLAVAPGHPGRRIAEWHACLDPRCEHRRYALVVTSDGFRHAHVLPVPARPVSWVLEPAGPTHFAISPNGGRRRLVDLSGRITAVELAGRPGPIAPGEIALRSGGKEPVVAVDPDTGRAHPLTAPRGSLVGQVTTPSGQLRLLSRHGSGAQDYSWSDDHGATWHTVPVTRAGSSDLTGLVPSPSDRWHTVVVGGDGATLFPLATVLASRDGGARFSRTDLGADPMAYGVPLAVLPDGRLLVLVDGWSDQRPGRPGARGNGLYEVVDGGLVPVRTGPPYAGLDRRAYGPDVLATVVTRDGLSLWAATPTHDGVVVSDDGGEHWRPVRAR